jgi:hypothetical protein
MKVSLSLLISFVLIVPSLASEVRIVSPDHARTYAFGEVVAHQLFVDDDHVLAARITFSNVSYATKQERRQDEAFDFRFVGTRFDLATRTFYVVSRKKTKVAVAVTRPGWLDEAITLNRGTKIYVFKESGRVTVLLSATQRPREGLQWVEVSSGLSLHSLLTSAQNLIQ